MAAKPPRIILKSPRSQVRQRIVPYLACASRLPPESFRRQGMGEAQDDEEYVAVIMKPSP